MTRALAVHRAGPGVSLQDMGRSGYLSFGISRGGAMDRLALWEGAALLGQDAGLAALEMGGMGGVFEACEPMRIALTGAPMRADLDGVRLAWNASHALPKGARLTIGGALEGSYGYLHAGGGFAVAAQLGSRSAHLAAGLGASSEPGGTLPVGEDPRPADVGRLLDAEARFDGGTVRIVPSPQTGFFPEPERARFEATAFTRDARGNRMGVRLTCDTGFESAAGLSILSEVIVPGDIQITGDGTPFVLLAECQTTGGYPRIGSVLPCDLPRVAQARPGAVLRFRMISVEEAVEVERRAAERVKGLRRSLRALVRDPADIHDLLSYQLVGGVTAGDELDL